MLRFYFPFHSLVSFTSFLEIFYFPKSHHLFFTILTTLAVFLHVRFYFLRLSQSYLITLPSVCHLCFISLVLFSAEILNPSFWVYETSGTNVNNTIKTQSVSVLDTVTNNSPTRPRNLHKWALHLSDAACSTKDYTRCIRWKPLQIIQTTASLSSAANIGSSTSQSSFFLTISSLITPTRG